MDLTLTIESGEAAGRCVPIPAGPTVRFGRLASSGVRLTDDPTLSGEHFGVRCDGRVGYVTDLGSRFGTLLNGLKVTEATLRDGDEIRAGRTVFSVRVAGVDPAGPQEATHAAPVASAATVVVPGAAPAAPLPPPPLSPLAAAAMSHLRAMPGQLYALLDAACEPTVPARLGRCGLEYESLYEGRGDELAAFGPWLVRLPAGAAFLEELARDGWGANWVVYLTTTAAQAVLHAHLRKFLISKLADGRQVYFRYYDPRILRTYLPTCTAAEVADFIGPVRRYACESVDGADLLEFAAAYRDWGKFPLGGLG